MPRPPGEGAVGKVLGPQEVGTGQGDEVQHLGWDKGWGWVRPGSMELVSCFSPPPLPGCNLPNPLIKSILEVIKASPKICSFSKLSLKKIYGQGKYGGWGVGRAGGRER